MDNGITKDPYLLIVNNIKKHLIFIHVQQDD